ncbi:hypothetical protein QOZ80_5AG0365320 [Eleusine coracana subsp. coracana]|nr:hypothetical protein QOZ80_5AG0365320 [Eleusine coracana subsp. coracana]
MAASRSGGVEQKQDLVIQKWAEMVSCCGVDWGCVPQLWNRVVLRKWLNIGSGLGDSDFSADECGTSDGETDREDVHRWYQKLSDKERILGGPGASTTSNQMKDGTYRLRRQQSEILLSQHTDVKELRVYVGTWNVGGIFPPSDLDIQEWLDMEEPADVYVFGFQEIVPLNAGNIFGAEDTRPVAVWEHIIRETLNKSCPEKSRFRCHSYPPSQSRCGLSDYDLAMEDAYDDLHSDSESNNDSDGELHLLIKKDTTVINKSGVNGQTSKYPSSTSNERIQKLKDFSSTPSRKTVDHLHDLGYEKLKCDTSEPTNRKKSASVKNQKEATRVRVGAMGYIGNKGSISVSMSIHQTQFCFVCCHLAAGEKEGDELKRNSNVEEIIRRTVFNPVPVLGMPMRIHDHERIIWLGDLNYRINLSFEKAHELISKQNWAGLLEEDQLKREFGEGCKFDGWVEGLINFPPTYKYEFDSENYVSDEPKSGRRTPAWCDRILSYGKGIRLLSYKRGELTLSDHRPVSAVYVVEVEAFRRRKFQRALTFTDAQVQHHQ